MLPELIARNGDQTGKRFIEFFTANSGNANTRDFDRRLPDSGVAGIGLGPLRPATHSAS